jgi:hypothetical protein
MCALSDATKAAGDCMECDNIESTEKHVDGDN